MKVPVIETSFIKKESATLVKKRTPWYVFLIILRKFSVGVTLLQNTPGQIL